MIKGRHGIALHEGFDLICFALAEKEHTITYIVAPAE